jgi:hypothetical protein
MNHPLMAKKEQDCQSALDLPAKIQKRKSSTCSVLCSIHEEKVEDQGLKP